MFISVLKSHLNFNLQYLDLHIPPPPYSVFLHNTITSTIDVRGFATCWVSVYPGASFKEAQHLVTPVLYSSLKV